MTQQFLLHLPDGTQYGPVDRATLEGWHRSPLAQAFIDRVKATAAAEGGTNTKKSFDTFLAQASPAGGAPLSDAERADLFKAFLEWSKSQGNN